MTHRVGDSSYLTVTLEGGVYLVNAVGTDCFKVGYSANIKKRLGSLATANHRKLVLAAWIPNAPQSEEAEIHSKLERFREEGEWFKLNPTQLALLVYERKFVPTDAFSHLDEVVRNEDLARALRMQLMGIDPVAVHSMALTRSLGELTSAVRSISGGGVDGPWGLEGLAMAIAGPGIKDSLSGALNSIASAIQDIDR